MRLPKSTPVQLVSGMYVKREDLCMEGTKGPPFSKMRGVIEHIQNRDETVIGVLDTYHSQGGHAVAYACHELGKRCINYWPRRKADVGAHLRPQQAAAQALGADLVAIPAGRSAVLYHNAKSQLKSFADSYMMPNALKLPEMVTATAREARQTFTDYHDVQRVIISISSGTIAAGVLQALHDMEWVGEVVLHMGYSRPAGAALKYIKAMAQRELDWIQLNVVDQGFAYGEAVGATVPFPCNMYYDAKAWRWALANPSPKTLFWNIGA